MCEAEFYGYGADKSLLSTTLTEAKAVTGSGVCYEALQSEITNAEALISSPTARMHDINSSILALRESIAKLSAGDAYTGALAKAEKVDEDLYTAESYFAFKAAYDAALAAKTADQMTTTAAALEEKIEALILLSTLSPVKLDKAADTDYFGGGGTWGKPEIESFVKMFDGDITTYADFASPGSGSGGFDARKLYLACFCSLLSALRKRHERADQEHHVPRFKRFGKLDNACDHYPIGQGRMV